ncbi:MAG: hypothetical protein U1U88_000028 [Lawsonella clevelandensis]
MSGLDEQLVGADGPRTILILGGTSEARQLAECLVENPRFGQCAIVSSLAGRVSIRVYRRGRCASVVLEEYLGWENG